MKPIKILLLGAGAGIGRHWHLPAILEAHELELAGVCDVDEQAARALGERFGVPWFTDDRRMLAEVDADAVDICTPDPLHAEQTLRAVRRGRHVICTKPAAMDLDEMRQIRDAVRQAGVTYMASHPRHWEPMNQAIQQQIASGRLGRLVHARLSFKGAFYPYRAGSWYHRRESRGQFLHNGPHFVDRLCQWIPARPLRVHGRTTAFYASDDDRLETANFTTATVRFDDGTIGSIEQNLMLVNPRGYPTRETITLIGTDATLHYDSHLHASTFRYVGGQVAITDPGLQPPDVNPFTAHLRHFARCVHEGREPDTGIDRTWRSLEICLRALDSAATGQAITLS